MAWWRPVGMVVAATVMVTACGASGDPTTSTSGGEGGFITGAGGGPAGTGGSLPATTGSGAGTTTTTGGGGMGVGGAATGGTGGVGGGCVDIGLGEPNETEATAWRLKMNAIDDCDDSGDAITGTLAPGDVDWFYYEGDDALLCVVDPTRSFSQSQSGLRLCKYVECLSGDTEIGGCPGGTTPDTSAEGRSGCCGTSGFDLGDVNCTGSADEHVYVYIRIDQPGGGASTCNDYTLDYHY